MYAGFEDDPYPVRMPVSDQKLQKDAGPYLRIKKTLSKETSAAVLQACRKRDITVSAAWMASQVMTVAQFQAARPGFRVGNGAHTMTMFDLRNYLLKENEDDGQNLYQPREHSTSCYFSALPVSVPALASFEEISQSFKEFFDREPSRDTIQALPSILEVIRISLRNAKTSVLMYSSIGVADNYVRHEYGPNAEIQVGDLWVGLTHTGPWLLVFCTSWKGQIEFSVSSNQTWYSDAELDELLVLSKNVMLKGLEIANV
ncbi:hypothetical protein F5Y15DRAFT_252938 [Xylariaceae sp. FL0016]|nr:hypothetical protein F5Y15DRAFT_252938 [Xylariaceae sp. FL0016]